MATVNPYSNNSYTLPQSSLSSDAFASLLASQRNMQNPQAMGMFANSNQNLYQPQYQAQPQSQANPNFAQLLSLLMALLANRNQNTGNTPVTGTDANKPSLGVKPTDTAKPAVAAFTGKGSIDGASFKSADGESYSLSPVSGRSYNLLSDKGLQLNGLYDGKNISTVGLSVGDDVLTFTRDGLLMIGDKPFNVKKNSLDGKITKSGETFTIATNEYLIKLSKGTSGVKVAIEATNAAADGVKPDGLWGASFDGVKQSGADVASDITVRDYVLDSLLEFSGNEIDAERQNQLIWQAFNPKVTGVSLRLNGNLVNYTSTEASPDIGFAYNKVNTGTFYNLFSDLDFQVSGKFSLVGTDKKLTETSIEAEGMRYTFKLDTAGALVAQDENGRVITASTGALVKNTDGTFTVKSGNDDNQEVKIGKGSGAWLDLTVTGNSGTNAVRSSGLLGDLIGFKKDEGTTDDDGVGYLRDADGATLRNLSDLADALEAYVLDAFETSGGRSVYEGYGD
jgi:hypothetical protein